MPFGNLISHDNIVNMIKCKIYQIFKLIDTTHSSELFELFMNCCYFEFIPGHNKHFERDTLLPPSKTFWLESHVPIG